MAKVIQKKNHWTTKVTECALLRDARGEANVPLLGGAERGEFAYVGAVNKDTVVYKSGTLTEGELILEIENLSISGLPLYDLQTIIKSCKGPIRIKTVRQVFVFFSCMLTPLMSVLLVIRPRDNIRKLVNQLYCSDSQSSTGRVSRSCLDEGS
ncbi:hypothetical protein DPEC_G00210370 [Dallia pectoralis]|uniref:Uncharacterized protein n=1 Tax=Dallia pectoralis TaxID=75939 RepID=A0ACC2G5Y1_DALPE|nr:hypothetical protein DPEC_G00210370 [Dallia pectoralis]